MFYSRCYEISRKWPKICIRYVDLLKHRVVLETLQEGEGEHERGRETAGADPPLDGA